MIRCGDCKFMRKHPTKEVYHCGITLPGSIWTTGMGKVNKSWGCDLGQPKAKEVVSDRKVLDYDPGDYCL